MIAALPLVSSVLGALAPSSSSSATSAQGAAAASGDFGKVMAQVASDSVHTMKNAETMATDGIQGKADLQSVVSSVMSAQESLQTALAIRDKSVAAFQEITRMSI